MSKHEITNENTTKVLTYDYDDEEGILRIYSNLSVVVEWFVDGGEDDIPTHINDFNKILDLGISIGRESI